jgi:arylsulfatase A-like enzyme
VEPRIDDGFRRFEWSHHPKPESFWPVEAHAYQRWLRDQGASWSQLYKAKKIPGFPDAYQAGMPERFHEVTWGASETIAAIRGGLRKPWFQCMHIFAPHPPFDPAPEYLERMRPADFPDPLYRHGEEALQERFNRIDHQTRKPVAPSTYPAKQMKAAYAAMVEHIDHEVGRILGELDRTSQRDNTIVVFFSDHGEMLGDHCLRQKGCRFYEGAVRIPLLISWPGRFRENLVSSELVELTDIVPTLLDTLGIAAPSPMNGRSLVPLLTGKAVSARHREFVRSEYYDTLDLPDHTRATMLRDDRYKLVIYHGHQLGELYDLAEDPFEFQNLFDDPRGQQPRKRLTEAMLDQLALTADIGQPRIGRF